MGSPEGEPGLEVLERLRLGLQIMALRALRDPDAAEEAVQETLVRALEALRDGRPSNPEKLGAFVRGIARHVIADTHRARQSSARQQPLSDGGPATSGDDPLRERNQVDTTTSFSNGIVLSGAGVVRAIIKSNTIITTGSTASGISFGSTMTLETPPRFSSTSSPTGIYLNDEVPS